MLTSSRCRLVATAALFTVAVASIARGATFNIGNGDVAGLKIAIITSNSNNQDDTINLAAGDSPTAVAVSPVTNKIYVANFNINNVPISAGAARWRTSTWSNSCCGG